MSIRLNFIVEGQTEETFVNTVLGPHLAEFSVWTSARCVETSRRRGTKYRGGIRTYAQAKRDIQSWIRNDRNPNARFTTMFDLYRLPEDFPGNAGDLAHGDPYAHVEALETALANDIGDWRFVPYLQLHEFEALLLANPQTLITQFPEYEQAVGSLVAVVQQHLSPELVDGGSDTAPSKRIIANVPEYAGRKASAGPILAERIGLRTLREKCPHFGEWLSKLERLADES